MEYRSIQYYWFKNKLSDYTWITFTEFYNKQNLKNIFIPITQGFGWTDTFSYLPTGEVIYINEEHKGYKGIWFVMNNIKIVIIEEKEL